MWLNGSWPHGRRMPLRCANCHENHLAYSQSCNTEPLLKSSYTWNQMTRGRSSNCKGSFGDPFLCQSWLHSWISAPRSEMLPVCQWLSSDVQLLTCACHGERQFQKCIHQVHRWSMEMGFVFSRVKARCLHFCKLGKLNINPCLKLDGAEIPVVGQHRFLGIMFGRRLA